VTNPVILAKRLFTRWRPGYRRDEFLTWLTFINPGMLTIHNAALMNHAVRNMPERGAVVEIGSFAGLSLNHIIHMMQQTADRTLSFR
jgi:hypothetical protein